MVADDAIAEVGGEPGRLPGHPFGRWRVTGHPVNRSREIQRFLDLPDLLMLTRRIYPGRITHGDPPDRHPSSPAAGPC